MKTKAKGQPPKRTTLVALDQGDEDGRKVIAQILAAITRSTIVI